MTNLTARVTHEIITNEDEREFWILKLEGELPEVWSHFPDLGNHPDFKGEIIHVREVKPK